MFAGFLGFSAGGLLLILFAFHSLKQKRKIENTPTSKIRSLAMGLVEIKGIANDAGKESLKIADNSDDKSLAVASFFSRINKATSNISPFTKKKCVYYSVNIEELRSTGKSSTWVQVYLSVYIKPFYVQDDTGKILIDPKDATFEPSQTFTEQSGFGKDPSKSVMDYLKDNNIKFEGFFGMNKKMRFTEKAIFEGDEVYVMGEAMPSGKMSSVSHENIVIGKKRRNGFYYISSNSEKTIIKKLNTSLAVFFILGGILFILGIILFMTVVG